MIDVAVAIDAEAVPVTLHTARPGVYVNGFYQEGTEASEAIMASVQPTNARELKDMPEGVRTEAVYTLRTRTRLREGDQIGFGGARWRALKIWPWPSFTKALLGEVK